MIEAILQRTYLSDRTIGELTFFDDLGKELLRLFTLERRWINNRSNESCIPESNYKVVPFDSDSHPDSYHILEVLDRDSILIHTGNFIHDSKGCILIGLKLRDLDFDQKPEVINSKAALKKINDIIGRNKFYLIITEK